MSISPPSDIVLDVALSADPARLKAGTRKLQAAASGPLSFEDGLVSVVQNDSKPPVFSMGSIGQRMKPIVPAAQSTSPATAYRGLEAFLLQTMIESMLPKNAENSFGKGTAGSVWKSMLSEHMANAVTRRGGVGVAAMLEKHGGAAWTADTDLMAPTEERI